MHSHRVRFLRLAVACVAILLGMQGWAHAEFSPVTDVEVLPPNPTSNDNISIRLSGQWNNGCVPRNPKASISAQSIRIDTSSPGDGCGGVLTPWGMTVFIGRLTAGSYDVTATYSGPLGSSNSFAQRTFTVTFSDGQNQSPWFGQNPARKELVFPFFLRVGPWDNGYNSVFDVINPNPSSAMVTFSFFDSTGKLSVPVSASGQGAFPGSAQLRLDGYAAGRVQFSFPGNGDFAGSAFVSSTQPVIVQEEISHHTLGGCAICLGPLSTKLKSRILTPAPLAARRQTLRVKFTPGQLWTNTAVALVFSWNPPPTGTLAALRSFGKLIFRNDNGIVLAEKAFALTVNEQLIGFVSDFFPAIAANGLSGSLEIIFDQEIFLTAVQVTTFGEEETWEAPNLGAAALQTLP